MDNMEVIWGLYIVKCGESGRLSLLFFSQNSSLDIWCSWGEMDLIDDIATEEAEKLVLKKIPELKQVFEAVG